MLADHDVAVGLHWHEDDMAGLEIACSCGEVLWQECDTDALIPLSEVNAIAEGHRDNY